MSAANNLVSQMSMYMNTRFDSACKSASNLLDLPPTPKCDVCNKAEDPHTKIKRCSRCHDRFYCGNLSPHVFLCQILMNPFFPSGKICQVSDWKAHKTKCVKREIWFDKHRKCRDGTVHEGKLEFITWTGEREGYTLGWGASFEEESEGLRNMFEERFRGDVQRFYATSFQVDMLWDKRKHGLWM